MDSSSNENQATSFPLKKIMHDLSLANDQQLFLMVLGIAEKISPGIYVQALGDPLSMEDKFREMIDSF